MRDPCTMEADLSSGVMMMGAVYSERACIMHAALTKHPAPDSTGVLSGVRLGLSSWVGCCIKFLEALFPPAYACKYSQAASACTHTPMEDNTQIRSYVSQLIKHQCLKLYHPEVWLEGGIIWDAQMEKSDFPVVIILNCLKIEKKKKIFRKISVFFCSKEHHTSLLRC